MISGKVPGLILFGADKKSKENYAVTAECANDSFLGIKLASNGEENFMTELAMILGVKKEEFPSLRIFEKKNGNIFKYKLEKELTRENVKEFLTDFKAGKLTSYLKNEAPVSNKGKSILSLNRNQFYSNADDEETAMVVGLVTEQSRGFSFISDLLTSTKHTVKDKKKFVFEL